MNILVLSPHPDDESIGCGGTIAKHTFNGDFVSVIFLTSGEKGGHGFSEPETINIREKEAQQAAKILKINEVEFWKNSDGNFIADNSNKQRLLSKIMALNPTFIYCPHLNEKHPDHVQTAQLAFEAIKELDGKKPVLLLYEIWTPLEHFNHSEDISSFIETKKMAIRAHESQCNVLKFDEAIIGLNRYRGQMHSWPQAEFVEVFLIGKV